MGGLATLLAAAVVQLAVVLHVRATAVDCASEGARVAALADRGPADGVARTTALLSAALSPAYAADVTATTRTVEGVELVVVTVRAPLPVAGLLGGPRLLVAQGRALEEST